MSRLTLQKSFFENLWPLILTANVCDTSSKNTCSFYEPDKTFDNIWLHAYLADRGFKSYQPPTVIRCCFDEKEEKLMLSEPTETTSNTDLLLSEPNLRAEDEHSQQIEQEEEEEGLYAPNPVDILSVERMAVMSGNFDQRRKLAHAFVNRQYPWYMQPPEYDAPFQLADYVHQEFNGKLQQAVIRDIHTFNCKLMFIDLAVQVCLHEMHQWLKFTRFAFIIVVARSQDAVKQIKLMGQNLTAVKIEEDIKHTWQEQLTESLHVCMAHASELGLVEYCTQSFAFVFSRNRNSCRLNTHRVLRMKA